MASIDTIEGVGPAYATKLRAIGIRSTNALLAAGGDRAGRAKIAKGTGLTTAQILEWVNRSDLMRVRGVGEEYSDLLEATGVDTVKELRNRNPQNLLAAMTELNQQKKLVRRLPVGSEVARWVEHAKTLPPAVSH